MVFQAIDWKGDETLNQIQALHGGSMQHNKNAMSASLLVLAFFIVDEPKRHNGRPTCRAGARDGTAVTEI